jgi:hypothetical protein
LRGLVANRNKFFNTTDGLAVWPTAVVAGREHVATVKINVVRVRATRRRRVVVAAVACVAQHAAIEVTVPGSGKNAVTGLNVSADRIIPEHGYSLGLITNGKSVFLILLADC